jgi:hypothetical protein
MTMVRFLEQETIESSASVVRSKNAGPFQITIDVFFKDPAVYDAFKTEGGLTAEVVANLYGIDVSDVLGIYFWDAVSAFKVTLRRAASAGSPHDNDCYGAQQQAPLLVIPVPQTQARLAVEA